MRDFILVAKAIANEPRMRILNILSRGELPVNKITEILGLSQSTVSKHLSVLYRAGLVSTKKKKLMTYYRLAGKEAPCQVRQALSWVALSATSSFKHNHLQDNNLADILRQ